MNAVSPVVLMLTLSRRGPVQSWETTERDRVKRPQSCRAPLLTGASPFSFLTLTINSHCKTCIHDALANDDLKVA